MGYVNTKQEILEYIGNQTEKLEEGRYEALTAAAVCEKLSVSRNLASQYLNEGFKEGVLVKVSTRPVYFLDKKTILERCSLSMIQDEFCDLEELEEFIQKHLKKKQNFEQAVGCNLSLKTAVEKCRVAVDYPPAGLPLYIEGARGTGKSFLAWLSYCYAKDTGIVPEEARFIRLDAQSLGGGSGDGDKMREELKQRLQKTGNGDFVVFEDYDEFPPELQLSVLHLIERRQTGAEQGKGRYILTLENGDCYEEYRKKLTFIRVTLPELSERSQVEKEMLLTHFLRKEEQRLKRPIRISEQAYRTLSRHLFSENVEELENCVKQLCAKAFSAQRKEEEIRLDLLLLPRELLRGVQLEFRKQLGEERFLTLSELRQDAEIYREIRLYSQVLDKFGQYYENRISYPEFLEESSRILDEYSEYILFRRIAENEKLRLIEQMLIRIFDYIRSIYNVDVPHSFVLTFSRWVYYSDAFNEMMKEWCGAHRTSLDRLREVLQKESRTETLIAREITALIRQNLEVTLSETEQAALTILLNHIRAGHGTLPIQAFIICHGYATASSIADVCNKLLKKHIFHAIDMPYDMSVVEVGKQLRNILYYSENRDVLMLVDLGSLENIEEVIGDVSDINFGIINNVSTNLALEIGFAINRGAPLAEILEDARENVKTSYKLIERAHREDVLIFVSESGSDVAARVGELFLDSLPKNLELTVKCYDYDTFTELDRAGELDKYNVLFAATTAVPIQSERFPMIPLEEIITFNSFPRLRECFNGYLSPEEFEQFRKNLLNVFSLQNVVEALTILNAGKVLSQVDAMLDELQTLTKRKFLEKTIVGLNIHISCLIERLVKKEEITTHLKLEHFEEEHGDFIQMVEKSFANIARQYNIRLVLSEIAYIYDYIHYEGGKQVLQKEEDF
ncbi:PRD domain-containing protein [Laedolimicola sp.]|uniref:PRD domain-containing protein n=1 Tax=Laedolimicola sp. TaxID=2981663 RepID=UPI003F7F8FF2